MKSLFLIISITILSAKSLFAAQDFVNCSIKEFVLNSSDNAHVQIDCPKPLNTREAKCSATIHLSYIAVDLTKPGGQNYLNMLTAAYLSDSKITGSHTKTCTVQPNVLNINHLRIAK